MTTQSKILKLTPRTGYNVIGWGIIKTSKYELYYIEAQELDTDEYVESKRYWISRNLYDKLNNYITVIDGKFKFIYEGKLEDIWYMYLTTNDIIKTSYGNKIKQDLEIYTHVGDYYLYSNYKLNKIGNEIDMKKLTPISELDRLNE